MTARTAFVHATSHHPVQPGARQQCPPHLASSTHHTFPAGQLIFARDMLKAPFGAPRVSGTATSSLTRPAPGRFCRPVWRCSAAADGTPGGPSSEFCAEQMAFLERKRLNKAGLGPAMPEFTVCPDCQGKGTVICWECKGTGVNERDCKEIMGSEAGDVRQQNGVINVMWFLFKGGPCFICRGKPDVPCVPCEGTGIKNFDLAQYTGD